MTGCAVQSTWRDEVGRVADKDGLGQLRGRWKSCERKNAAKGASLGGRAGREDDFHFEYVKLNVFVCYPNG